MKLSWKKCAVTAFIAALSCTVMVYAQKSAWVTADGGLRLRAKPGADAAKITVIPFGSEVGILEETGEEQTISGEKGRWTKVTWEGKTGWAFGGFLTDKPFVDTSMNDNMGRILQELPSGWTQLTRRGDRFLIYKYCFAGVRHITINLNKPAEPLIEYFLGQDSDFFMVLNAKKTATGAIVTIKNKYAGKDGKQWNAELVYAKGKKIAVWKNLHEDSEDKYFVSDAFASTMPTEKENNGKCEP